MTQAAMRAAVAAHDWPRALQIGLTLEDPDLRMMSNCYTELGDLELALDYAQRAVLARPDNAACWYQLGVVHQVTADAGPGHYVEAHLCYERAFNMFPDSPVTATGLGASMVTMGQHEAALQMFRLAQRKEPFPSAGIAEAGTLKILNRWEEGWRADEARMDIPDGIRTPKCTVPLADLRDRRVIVRAEQGFGDVIQFMRYVPKLHLYCREAVFEVHEGMEALCSTFTETKTVSAPYLVGDDWVSVNLLSLPLLLGPAIGWEPIPPLQAPGVFRRSRSGIGICPISLTDNERVDTIYKNSVTRRKRAPWEMVVELAKEYGPFRSLTHEDLGTEDWFETATVLGSMELVLSIDTAVAHLAASLGTETWLLQRFDSCWRWNKGWYGGNVRVFKQDCLGDWESVFRQVREAFAARNT